MSENRQEAAAMIFDVKRYALHDGPGIRTTVFFKGCPLHCSWCHNPEGIVPRPELMYRRGRCLDGCRECAEACPEEAITREAEVIIEDQKCRLCGTCAHTCPSEALILAGREMSVSDVILEVERDRPFYDQSGGGITLSGGEPLFQPDFLEALLEKAKERGLHTCLDTSGYSPWDIIDRIRSRIDLFLFDLKMIDEERHREITGVSNAIILENLRRLGKLAEEIVVRIPLVAGVNDNEKDMKEIAAFLDELNGSSPIDLLPCHSFASSKYGHLGREEMPESQNPSPERIRETVRLFREFGFNVTVGGES